MSRPPTSATAGDYGIAAAAAVAASDLYSSPPADDDTSLNNVIVPPPTPTNPIPVLPLALKIDNREQLLAALMMSSSSSASRSGGGGGAAGGTSSTLTTNAKQQTLVFSSSSFRSLLLRHVLDDPSSSSGKSSDKTSSKKKKKSSAASEAVDADTFPNLPAFVNHTDVLIQDDMQPVPHDAAVAAVGAAGRTGTASSSASAAVTYVLSASSLMGSSGNALVRLLTEDIFKRKQQSAKTAQFRIWVLPQPGAYLTKVLRNALLTTPGGTTSPHSSNPSSNPSVVLANAASTDLTGPSSTTAYCQLDWFPLETDVLSMECDSVLREAIVEQVPSRVIQASARALLKLQDVIGVIPRIQAYGSMAEDVVRKFMNLQLDEYLSNLQQQGRDDGGEDPIDDDANKNSASSSSSLVAAMIVIDRRIDCVTPLLTPLTYEGLLDEVFGIDAGHLHVPASVLRDDDDNNKGPNPTSTTTPSPTEEDKLVALPLHSGDALYGEVRDQHVEQFGTFLQNQARALKESHANFTSTTKKKDLAEIHQFVKQIPVFTQNLKSLTNHIQLAEKIKAATQRPAFREQWQLERSILEGESTTLDAIEDLMAAQYPVWKLLRLLCLQSVCQGGIKSSRYDSIKRDVVQTYGYRYLLVLANLEKAGLLSRREGLWVDATVTGSAFYNVRNSLHLIHAEVDTIDPDDIAYVSSGYAPLSVRIIQTSIKGWTNGREDVLKENLGGGGVTASLSSSGGGGGSGTSGGVRFIDVLQRRSANGAPEDLAAALKRKPPGSLGQWAEAFTAQSDSGKKPTLVVFYLGGVTYMELASLRFLSKRPNFPYHILCVTSKIVNGSTMLRTLSL